MDKPILIPRLFTKIVERTSLKLVNSLRDVDEAITGIHYIYGHPLEVLNTLMLMSGDADLRFKKYPLITLFLDIKETSSPGFYSEADLHFLIITGTNPNYTAPQREDFSFTPILHPIYGEFIEQIRKSGLFSFEGSTPKPYERFDRLFWGKEGLYGVEGNIFNDNIDAIEFKIRLKVKTQNC